MLRDATEIGATLLCICACDQALNALFNAAVWFDPARLIPGDVRAPVFVLEAKLRRKLVHRESEGFAALFDFFFGHGPRTLPNYVAWRNSLVPR